MNRSGITFKRILTGVLASAMILTATPSYAFADELAEDTVYNDELQNDPILTVTLTGENCYIEPGYNLVEIGGLYKLSQVEGINADSFEFTVHPAEHYAALTAGNVEVSEGTVALDDGTFTVSAPGEGGKFTKDISVTVTAVPKINTATVDTTDAARGKLTFTAGSGMTPVTGHDNKYKVSEVGNFTFTIKDVAAHYSPVVKIGESTITPTVDEGTYTYTVNGSQYTGDFDIDVDVTQETRHTLSGEGNAKFYVSVEENPSDLSFALLCESNDKYYKDDVVYYIADAKDGFRVSGIKIGSEEQTKVEGKDYYKLTFPGADTTITAETVEQSIVSVTDTSEMADLLYYYEAEKNGDTWQLGDRQRVIFSDSTVKISIDKGNSLFIVGTDFPYDIDYTLAKYKQGDTYLPETEIDGTKGFLTGAFTGTTGDLTLEPATLETTEGSKQIIVSNPESEITGVTFSEGTVTKVGDKSYAKATGGLGVVLEPATGKTDKSLVYEIDNGAPKPATKTADHTYTIPEEDVQAAIMAGKITLIAEVGNATVSATFNKDTNTGHEATIKTKEFKVIGDEYVEVNTDPYTVPTWSEAGTATLTIGNGNVLAVEVTPADGQMLLSDSVKLDGVTVEKKTSGTLSGKYVVMPRDGASVPNKVTVTSYAKVAVTNPIEATGIFKDDGEPVTLTSSMITAGRDSSGNATGAKIEIIQKYASGYDDNYVTLKTPKVIYTDKYDKDQELYFTKVSGQDYKYEITASEVENIIKNIMPGASITINAKADANKMATITMSTGGNVVNAIFSVYASEKSEKVLFTDTLDDNETIDVRVGHFVRISAVDGAELSPDTDFIRVSSGTTGPVSYGDKDDEFAVGTVSTDITVKVESSKLDKSKVKFDADPKDDLRYEVKGEVPPDYLDGDNVKVINSVNPDDLVKLAFYVDPVEDVKNYKVKPLACFYEVGDEHEEFVATTPEFAGEDFTYRPPFEALAKAAFDTDGITFTAGVEDAGYQKQAVVLVDDYENTVYTASVAGESLEYSGGWDVPYNKDLDVSLVPKLGFEIDDVRYAPAVMIDAMDDSKVNAWLHKPSNKYVTVIKPDEESGAVFFTISPVDERYYIYVTTAETTDVTLTFEGKEVSTEYEKSVDYNKNYSLQVLEGATPVDLHDAKWSISATVPGNPTSVEGDVIDGWPWTSETTTLSFNGSKVAGKVVTINIKSTDNKQDWTVKLDVAKKYTDTDIKFASGATGLQIGKYERVDLTVPAPDTIEAGKVGLRLTADGCTSEALEAWLDCNLFISEKKVSVSTEAEDYGVLTELTDLKIQLVNLPYRTASDVISETALTVNANEVKNADISAVTAKMGSDSVTFDFSGVNKETSTGKFDRFTDGLYYLLTAEKKTSGHDDFITVTRKMIPAWTSGTYELPITDSPDAFSAEELTYDLKVELVQVKAYNEGVYNETYKIEMADSKMTKEGQKTVVDGVFATKLTFTKNKYLKTIFNTMDGQILGIVSFPDAAKNVPVTVQRLRLIEIRDKKTGEVYADSKNDPDVISIDEYRQIWINPDAKWFSPGNYTMVTYAMEPQGVDVSVKYAFSIAQGITGIEVSAPAKVYKAPGKAASVKATASFDPGYKPAVKKVTWSLKDNDDPANISINKSGTVNIGKNAKVPAKFTIVATAADYEGHEDKHAETDVTVTSIADTPGFLELGGTEIVDGGVYYTSQFNGRETFMAYDSDYDEIDAAFSVSGITAVKDENKVVYSAKATKPVNNASVTVVSADGSKAKKVFKFKVISDEDLQFRLTDYDYESIAIEEDEDEYTAENMYPAGKPMTLTVSGKNDGFITHAVKPVGLKQVKCTADTDGTTYTFNPTAQTATLTIYEGSKKSATKTITINITNARIPASTVRTSTSVTASNMVITGYNSRKGEISKKDNKGTIFNNLYFEDTAQYEKYGHPNKVTYTVKNSKTPYEGKVLVSTADPALATLFTAQLTPTGDEGEYTATTNASGQFEVDYEVSGKLGFEAGTHSFTLTPVDDDLNPVHKPVEVKVKAAPAPKASVAVNKVSFTNFDKVADFAGFKTMKNIVFYNEGTTVKTTADFVAGQAGLKGINISGTINRFSTVFSVEAAGGTLNGGKLKCVQAPAGGEKPYDPTYDAKKGMTGWVKYSWKNLDGSDGSQWVKVTVKGDITPLE